MTANTGTLSGSTITVEDEDGNFNGVISAAEGTNFAPANLAFAHSKETVGGGSGKRVPTLKLYWNADGSGNPMTYGEFYSTFGYKLSHTYYVRYDGDGKLRVAYTKGDYNPSISLNGNKLTIEHESGDYTNVYIVVYAPETATCMGVHTMFCYDTAD